MAGWIKIERDIIYHWIWTDPVKLKWWLDLLLMVNHSDTVVNLGFQLLVCSRGQSVMSLKSWAERWGVSKDTVRNYFVLLCKDKMISIENLKITTRITICNYDAYQTDLHGSHMVTKRKVTSKSLPTHPNKNVKNEEEVKKLEEENIHTVENPEFHKFNVWIKTYCPNVCKMKTQMKEKEFFSLNEKYSSKVLMDKLLEMENKADLITKYVSVPLTLRNWLKKTNNN